MLPPAWLLLALSLMGALHLWLPIATWIERPWSSLGFVVIAAAMVLVLVCARRFHLAKTGIRPFTPANELVVTGAFRFTRNPMYVGLTFAYFGLALIVNWAWPIVLLPVVLIVMNAAIIEREEKYLSTAFPEAYGQYSQKTRRWL